jgi:tRNA-splicing ligase RtcB (3'-phosphate/5'-hydroxy nucleic acid ligase)
LNAVPKQQTDGLWRAFHRQMAADLPRVERHGSLPAQSTPGLDDFLGGEALSRDNQIGSIGGGNHFVEIQRVERILDGSAAHAWGLKTGQVTVMVHTGSVAIGHLCGGICREIVRRIYPPNAKQPENGVFLLPDNDRFHAEMQRFWDSLHNAGNFAFANRLFLALMAVDVLRATVGDCDAPLLYDAPHNLVWKQEAGDAPLYVHRKGACPARGPNELAGTPFQYHGEPVLVPGSMGASSFILAGQGCDDSLSSASHGAGRALSRGDALKASDAEFEKFMRNFRVVTPVDFNRPDVKMRRDIVAKKLEDIKKEAPFAYKGIGPVVKTLETAGIARPVAELKPLMTIKG